MPLHNVQYKSRDVDPVHFGLTFTADPATSVWDAAAQRQVEAMCAAGDAAGGDALTPEMAAAVVGVLAPQYSGTAHQAVDLVGQVVAAFRGHSQPVTVGTVAHVAGQLASQAAAGELHLAGLGQAISGILAAL